MWHSCFCLLQTPNISMCSAGHLKKSELVTPSMPPTVPQASVLPQPAAAASQAPVQQPLLPGLVRRESRPLAIVDPKDKAAVGELGSVGTGSAAGKAGKCVIAIVDPKSRQQLLPAGSASGNQLTRTESSSSAATNHDKPGKKLITIVDPNNKQPVQLPVQPLGSSRLARSSSNISAASSDSNSQPLKRTIAIVDPQNKQPIVLPDTKLQPRQSITTPGARPMQASRVGADSTRRTKTPMLLWTPPHLQRSSFLPTASATQPTRLLHLSRLWAELSEQGSLLLLWIPPVGLIYLPAAAQKLDSQQWHLILVFSLRHQLKGQMQ